jgi:predicted DNA-binding protein (MmcQ/YjbR family)
MDIPKSKLGLETEEIISVVNLKSDPLLIGSLHKENGIFPAYHMNKSHWITILLDGSVEEEKLKLLLNMSYDMTLKKTKK